jgi:hypothetical protein
MLGLKQQDIIRHADTAVIDFIARLAHKIQNRPLVQSGHPRGSVPGKHPNRQPGRNPELVIKTSRGPTAGRALPGRDALAH